MINVINNSGGRTSAFMTETLLAGGIESPVILFCNTGLEDEKTLEFVQKCSSRWFHKYGHSVTWLEFMRLPAKKETGIGKPSFKIVDFKTAARIGEPFSELVTPRKDLPNRVWRECTNHLKIKTMLRYLHSRLIFDFTSYVGIRYDEPRRWVKEKETADKYGYLVKKPLVDWKTTKEDVLIGLPEMLGFDLEIEHEIFGNCNLCFLKGVNKRMEVLRRRPELAKFWIDLEESKKKTFVNGITTRQILNNALTELFPYDPTLNTDISCTCNTD